MSGGTSRAKRLGERLVINPDESQPQPERTRPAEGAPGGSVTVVPASAIAHNPRNPRDDYDDIGELADSIKQVGVLQPLGIVSAELFLAHYPGHEAEVGGRRWVALTGNRRLAAAQQAGLADVPVHVLDGLGEDAQLDEAPLVENIHREALPPLREAAALELLVQRHGSQRKAAARIGKSQGFISQRISLLRLPEALRVAVSDGTLTVEVARAIAALPVEAQQQMVDTGPPYRLPESAPERGRKRGRGASAGAWVIRVNAHEPGKLAAVLRDKLSPEERAEVARLLTEE